MSGPADEFEAGIDALSNVRLAESGEYLHEYTGVLAETGERVRIVTLAPELADIDGAVDAFTQVSDRWYNASANANILTIRDRGAEPRPWIAVPDYRGDTLATLQPNLSADATETIIGETADALRTLGLYNTVHGYLSPDDIYLPDVTDETGTLSVHVGGFGLEAAIQAAISEFTPTAYTAPELLDNPGQPTEQTDVYGLAAVTYFALTGSPPMEGDDLDQAIRDGPSSPPSAYDGAIPAELDDVVMKAFATLPEDRYDSPYAFSRAFASTFAPDDFRPDNVGEEGGGEAETADSSESDDTASAEDGDDAPSDEDADSTESDDIDATSVTRRVAVGLLGVGALGGGAWYLSRGQLIDAGPAEETTAQTTPEPSVSISVTPSDPSVGEEVRFSATATEEGVSLGGSYDWAVGTNARFVEGESTRTHSFSEPGEYTVRLRTVDSYDRTVTARTTVTVEPPADGAVADGAPMFQYNPANTGTAPDENGPQTSVGEQWSFQTGGSVKSQPAVVDGTVYVGSEDSNVYALSAEDGTEQWAYQAGDRVYSSPAVVDGTVYVGSHSNNVYALSADDGTEQWSFQTGNYVESSPTVVDGTVYVGSGLYNLVGNDGASVYALSAEDGTEQWSFQAGGWVESAPAVVDGTVYVGSEDSNVYALSADDGTEQWSFQTGEPVLSSPAVVDGIVYVGSYDNTVYALSAADGTEQWSYQTGDFVGSSLAVVDGTVYVGGGDGVYALSAADGTEQWSFQIGDNVYSAPTVVDGTVYVGGGVGGVYALSAEDGSEQWSFQIGDPVLSAPAVVDGTVYVGSLDNNVYALSEE